MENLENKSKWFIGGGILASLGASLCCIGPLVFTILGISGAAYLREFEVLRVPLIIVIIIAFAFAGYFLFKKRAVCMSESICADPVKYRKMVIFYWIGLAIAIIAMTSPYWIGWFFD